MWQLSAILNLRADNGFFERPMSDLYYRSSIETIALNFLVLRAYQNIVRVTQGHRRWHHSIDAAKSSSSSIITMVVCCSVFEI